MNRLGYRGKFVWLGLLVAIAIGLLFSSLKSHHGEHIESLENERVGIQLIRQATTVIRHLQQHRGRSASVLGGNTKMALARHDKSLEVSQALHALTVVLPDSLKNHPELTKIRITWEEINAKGLTWSVDKNFQKHNKLIDEVLSFLVTIGDNFHLVLDDDIGSYYLIDLLIDRIPALTERMGKLRAYGSAIINSGTMTAQRRFELISLLAELRTIHDQAQKNLLRTMHVSPQQQAALQASQFVFEEQQGRISQLVQQHVLTGPDDIDPEEFFQKSTAAIDAVFSQLFDVLYPLILNRLESRAEEAQRHWQLTLIALVSLLSFVLYLAAGSYIAVLGGVREVLLITRKLAGGELQFRTRLDSFDEIGKIGQSINEMADALQALMAEQESNRAALESHADRLRLAGSVFAEAREGISITDTDGVILDVNPMLCTLTGYQREELIGHTHRLIKSPKNDDSVYARLWSELTQNGHWQGEMWNRRKDARDFAVQLSISALRNDKNEIRHYVSLCSDVTELKLQHEKMEHLAHHDKLTGLPNRTLLSDRLHQALARARRNDEVVAVVGVDLDGFKAVNDTFGHEAGDALLVEVARRLENSVRAGDTVARLGGDEFVLILANAVSAEDCERVLRRVLSNISRPVSIEQGQKANVSGSLGYTLFPDDDTDADGLLRHADVAMYAAKQSGKNRFCRFDIKLDQRRRANANVLGRLGKGLDNGEFSLFIQPKVDFGTGTLLGAEALLRWQHPIRGVVAPAQFIPLIEEDFALSLKFSQWVLNESLRLMTDWAQQGVHVPLSINMTGRQLLHHEFLESLSDALAKHADLGPDSLEIEILESAALDDITQVAEVIKTCQQKGVRFALDDFGTGYSTLTYLKQLSVNTLKIDQSFIWDMEEDASSRAIVQGVIGLASAFGYGLVAEGVETAAQARQLIQMGCTAVQGYLVAKPMPPQEVVAWIRDFKLPELD